MAILRDAQLWRRPPPAASPAAIAAELSARRAQLCEVNRRHLEALVRQRLIAAAAISVVDGDNTNSYNNGGGGGGGDSGGSGSTAGGDGCDGCGSVLTLEDVDTWVPVIARLATQASAAVRPALAAAGSVRAGGNGGGNGGGGNGGGYVMDPRAYVKIKRIASGDPGDSSLIARGEVFRRNVAHRRMPSRQDPSLFTLSRAIFPPLCHQ